MSNGADYSLKRTEQAEPSAALQVTEIILGTISFFAGLCLSAAALRTNLAQQDRYVRLEPESLAPLLASGFAEPVFWLCLGALLVLPKAASYTHRPGLLVNCLFSIAAGYVIFAALSFLIIVL